MSTNAFEYYQHQGFVLAESNDPKCMPETLWNWSQQAKDEKEKNPYVYFVTDKELINDAKSRNKDPDAPEVQAQLMHLMKLEGLLKVTGTSGDINEVYLVETCLPKCSEDTLFLQFPFPDTGQRINTASTVLFNLKIIEYLFSDCIVKFESQ